MQVCDPIIVDVLASARWSYRFLSDNVKTCHSICKQVNLHCNLKCILRVLLYQLVSSLPKPCHVKNCLLGFLPGPAQTRLSSNRRWLEAWNLILEGEMIVLS